MLVVLLKEVTLSLVNLFRLTVFATLPLKEKNTNTIITKFYVPIGKWSGKKQKVEILRNEQLLVEGLLQVNLCILVARGTAAH